MHASDRKTVSAPTRLQTGDNSFHSCSYTIRPNQKNDQSGDNSFQSGSYKTRPNKKNDQSGDNGFQSYSYKTRLNQKNNQSDDNGLQRHTDKTRLNQKNDQSGDNGFQSCSYKMRPNRSAKRAVINHQCPSCRPQTCAQPVAQPRLGPTCALADAAARPVTWLCFHSRLVPTLASL
jgi:hypothetical protein